MIITWCLRQVWTGWPTGNTSNTSNTQKHGAPCAPKRYVRKSRSRFSPRFSTTNHVSVLPTERQRDRAEFSRKSSQIAPLFFQIAALCKKIAVLFTRMEVVFSYMKKWFRCRYPGAQGAWGAPCFWVLEVLEVLEVLGVLIRSSSETPMLFHAKKNPATAKGLSQDP